MRGVLVIFVGLAILGIIEAAYHGYVYFAGRRGRELRRRLQSDAAPAPLDAKLLRQGRFSSIPRVDRWLSKQRWARRIEHLLEQADSGVTVAQLLTFSTLGLVAGAAAGLWLGPAPAVALAIGGGVLPVCFPCLARERRSRKLSEQLPEAIEMMARSLRAGHALPSAFQLVATEMPEPIAVEFARAFEEPARRATAI
jgi:tight adherence protein B